MNEVITASDASASLRSASYEPSIIPSNLPLLAALLSLALAQFLKLFTSWYKDKRWDSRKMLGSGGMPSSHSATVMALAVAVGLEEGIGGSTFAVAVVLACVVCTCQPGLLHFLAFHAFCGYHTWKPTLVMYDATGVRLHAGRQAELLNQIVCELPPEHPISSAKPLRDSLGHTPIQVAAGAVLGCVVALLMRSSS